MSTLISSPFEWAVEGLLACLATGLVFSAVVGVLLILRPGTCLRINLRLSRWVDTREFLGKLDRAWNLEPLFYRHHRVLGGSLVTGAVYVLWQWLCAYDRAEILNLLAPRLQAQALDWIVAGLEWAAVVIHVLALFLGVVILTRPSLIKGLEARANHWYGPNGFAAMLDRVYHTPEQWLVLRPRLLGLLALGGSAYALLALYPRLLIMFRV